jgi:hypothetical protein
VLEDGQAIRDLKNNVKIAQNVAVFACLLFVSTNEKLLIGYAMDETKIDN